jgi:dUTP pyrophosphatase
LINLSTEDDIIEHGARIAQLVFAKIESVDWEQVEFTETTSRGSGGFGSTGIK